MRVLVAALVRNEAGRFLKSALRAWSDFADEIVVLDDSSTDDSRSLCRAAGATVIARDSTLMWGNEAPARASLWNAARVYAKAGDIVCVLDADMVPAQNPRPLFELATADAFSFPLFDLWRYDPASNTYWYRTDGMWAGGPRYGRLWAVRMPEATPEAGWLWPDKALHTGHFPLNLTIRSVCTAPIDHAILHYAYVTPELREAKAAQYAKIEARLLPEERAHARSILEPPTLAALPFEPSYELELA